MTRYPLPIFVQRFFTERLANQLAASANTVASYRDTFRLLLTFATDSLGRQPTDLLVTDVDADLVGRFLDFVETSRGNSARSRNTRLAAIRSFFKYVAINEPELLHHCQRVLALPSKRHEKRMIDYLDREQVEALLTAPDLSTWYGRRDRALLHLCVQTGLRVSELIGLRCGDVVLGTGAHVQCRGKGRKDRSTPLRASPPSDEISPPAKSAVTFLRLTAGGSNGSRVSSVMAGVALSQGKMRLATNLYPR